MYDIIIIGAGPAGISAGIYAVSRGLKTLIIEKNKVGGIIGNVSTVTHYTAVMKNESGATFAARMKEQAESAGVEIVYGNVTSVSLKGDVKTITTSGADAETDNTETHASTYEAKRVIIAGGSTPRKLGIPGEAELAGHGIGLNAAKNGAEYYGKNIYVVGGADGAVKEALYLSQFAKKLTIIHFEEKLGCIPEFSNKVEKTENIKLMLNSRLTAVSGNGLVEKLEIHNEKSDETVTIDDSGCGVFIYAGTVPNTELYTELELESGYIPVNSKMETGISGVYAAGDIRVKQVRQVATAVNDGAIAAINAAASLCL